MKARAYIRPVAAPSVLGLCASATATFMAGAYPAEEPGGATGVVVLFGKG